MSALDDAWRHAAYLHEKFGGQDLPDIGGSGPGSRLEVYRRLLFLVRAKDAAERKQGTLGWDTLSFEELLEALTAQDNQVLYDELIDLIGCLLCWADAVRDRNAD